MPVHTEKDFKGRHRYTQEGELMMKRKTLTILLLTTLVLSVFAAIPVNAADPDLKIVVQLKGGLEAGQQLVQAMEDISNAEWAVVFDDLMASDLSDADMLILIQSDMAVNYTTAEKSAVKSWFMTPGKTLWICSDSDFSDQYLRIPTANDMLEYLDSKLRAESVESADPNGAEGADYRVLGQSYNVDPEFKFLVDGVTQALFHGPGLIYGYLGGVGYKLEEVSLDGVYVIMTTTPEGIAVDFEPPVPEVHEVGYEGNLTLLALEKLANGNSLYVGADAPFAHYTPMYRPEIVKWERYGVLHPQQGGKLFENIVNYAIRTKLTAEITGLDNDVSALGSEKAALESQVSTLEGEKSSLEDDVADLESGVATLESDVATLETSVTDLEADVTAAKSSASTWQMYAIGALVIGLALGFFVGPMIRK